MKREINDNQLILFLNEGKPTDAAFILCPLLVLLRASHMKLQK